MEKEKGAGMQLNLQFSAAPQVHFYKGGGVTPTGNDAQFGVQLQTAIGYATLNNLIAGYLVGKRIEISEGLISGHVVVRAARVAPGTGGNLLVQVQFGGTFNGNLSITGKPVYDEALKAVRVAAVSYELETGSLLLRMARSLLQSRIARELSERSVFPLQPYLQKAEAAVNGMLNKTWSEAVETEGSATDISLVELTAAADALHVKALCRGKLVIKVAVE